MCIRQVNHKLTALKSNLSLQDEFVHGFHWPPIVATKQYIPLFQLKCVRGLFLVLTILFCSCECNLYHLFEVEILEK